MTYTVGTHIDLTNLNANTKIAENENVIRHVFERPCEVGTRFVFRPTAHGLRAAMSIPVAFA